MASQDPNNPLDPSIAPVPVEGASTDNSISQPTTSEVIIIGDPDFIASCLTAGKSWLISPASETARETAALIEPYDGRRLFTLKELYRRLHCDVIQVVNLTGDRIMIMDENAKLKNPWPPVNETASFLYGFDILGPVIVCPSSMLK